MAGPMQDVYVTLVGLTHGFVNDFDILLVAPSGENLVLMSDVGESTWGLKAIGADVVVADHGDGFPAEGELASGTYLPSNEPGGSDTFSAPAPTPGPSTTFAQAFSGLEPNGTWSLYVVDDSTGDQGSIDGGWSLTITTSETAAATVTTFTMDPNPAFNGEDDVTFTAVVTSGGEPVTDGTVTFTSPYASYPGHTLDSQGRATLTSPTMLAVEDVTQKWTATYDGTASFLTSSAAVDLVIIDRTVVSGNQYCNPGRTMIPDIGTARGYPLQVFVEDRAGATVTDARVHLLGLEHPSTGDLDIMLVSPDGDSLMLLSDVPGALSSPTNVVIADDGAETATLPGAGAVRPTNADDGGSDALPAPAPAPSDAESFADSIAGGTANGTWSLYIVDDASGDGGFLTDGWCLELNTQAATTLALDAPSTATTGDDVQVTATVTSSGDPVGTGTVSYSVDGGTAIEAGTPDASGQVTFTIADIPRGAHTIAASYTGTGGYSDSTADPVQVTAVSPTTTTITTDPTTPVAHQPVEIAVAVIGDGAPVTEGTVNVVVGTDETTIDAADLATETVTITPTSTDPIQVTATYSGADTFAASEAETVLTPVPVPTTLALTAPTSAVDGDSVTLTARVTANDSTAVPTGTVTFSVGRDVLGTAPVAAGGAELSTTLLAGAQTVTATFTSSDAFGTSQGEAEIKVSPVIDVDGLYQVAEGDSVTLLADGSGPAVIGWDLDGDGTFSDAAGREVTLTWDELEALGIDDGPAEHVLGAQAAVDGLTATNSTTLQVTNTGPDVIIDGPSTAVVGEPLTLKLSADDPSSADMADLFTYIVDWGDGSPVEQVVGPADPPVSHTYTTAGQIEATFSVLDRDGDSGGELTITVTAEPAAADGNDGDGSTTPPTDEPTEVTPGDPGGSTADTSLPAEDGTESTGEGLSTTGFTGLGLAAAAVLLTVVGLLLVVRRRLTA